MNTNGHERRRFPRAIFPCKIIIGYSFKRSASYTENISEDGVKIILDIPLRCLSIVGLELFLERDNPIICKGKVVWVEDRINPVGRGETLYYTGITFTEMSFADRERIKSTVKSLLSKENGSGVG